MKTLAIALPALAALAAHLAADAAAQELRYQIDGPPGAKLGCALAAAGDFDGDGTADLALGSPGANAAAAYSAADGLLLAELTATAPFGQVVAAAGDLDGDGLADFAVGAPSAVPAGKVYLVRGGSGELLRVVEGTIPGERFGAALAPAADADGDGTAELAIGAPAPPLTGSGRVLLYSFAKDSFLRVLTPFSQVEPDFGSAVADAGDADQDGASDVLVGSPHTAAETARIYSGATGLLVRSLSAGTGWALFGYAVAGLGPISGTGNPCVAVGSPNESNGNFNAGGVRVYDAVSGQLIHELHGSEPARYGAAVAAGGDFNGDGFGDFLIGAPGFSDSWNGGPFGVFVPGTGPGRVFACDGPTSFALHVFEGTEEYDGFGTSLAGLGSIDGDPLGEIAIGAPEAALGAGSVYVYGGLAPCGTIFAIGSGCIGTAGIAPELALEGCAKKYQDSALTLSIAKGPHFPTTALLFLGAGSSSIWLNPICKLQLDQLVGAPLALPLTPISSPIGPLFGSGHVELSGILPALGTAASFRMQALILDPGAPFGISATNAIQLTLAP